jgi:PAS domain S-box-containing protein
VSELLQDLEPGLVQNESEARFRALAEASWEGICFSENGVILDANTQLAEMLGYTQRELIGRRVIDLVAPQSVAALLRAMRVRSSEPNEFLAQRKDGGLITVEARAQTVQYKGRPVRMTAVRDITERARAQEHRRALVAGTAGVAGQHFFRSLVKHLARALNARCAFVAELIEPENHWLRFLSVWNTDAYVVLPEAPLSATVVADVIAGGLRFYDGDVAQQLTTDSVLAPLSVSSCAAISLQDAAGRALGVLAVAGDRPLQIDDNLVSTLRIFAARGGVEIERIRGERQVRAFNQQLEQRVADRTRELESANRELEAFSYSVSHDLRAPLRHILGFVDLLGRDLQATASDAVTQHLRDISDAATRMNVLIETLLDFSRVGRADLSMTTVDPNEIVSSILTEASRHTAGRRIEWVVTPLPLVQGDAALIRQVFANLVDNALKFTRPRETARIEIGTEFTERAGRTFFVRDNGVGFNMQRAAKLFGVFQRLHPPSKFEGTGIGLANVQRIVLRHGGQVWAASEVEKGATFYFSMPSAEVLA